MEKNLIIIPAYNEEKNIESVVENVMKLPEGFDYLVVNDGSNDNTLSICLMKGYNVLNLPINLGIGGAVQAGYRYAKVNGYDIAIQMDGDGQHNAAFVEAMTKILQEGKADVVIGSRFVEKEGFQTSKIRRSGICFLSLLIRLTTGIKVYDVTSGFRAVNRKMIEIYSKDYSSDYPEPEAIITAVMYGASVEEIPVIMNARRFGKSSIQLWDSVYYMIKVTLAILIRRISYGIRREK